MKWGSPKKWETGCCSWMEATLWKRERRSRCSTIPRIPGPRASCPRFYNTGFQNRICNRFRTCSRFQKKPQRRRRQCKNVNDCYFMDVFACGFKTRCFAPQTVEATDGSFRLIKLRNRFLYFTLPSPPLRFPLNRPAEL